MIDISKYKEQFIPWDQLSEKEQGFFTFDDDELPLHRNHAARISLIKNQPAREINKLLFNSSLNFSRPDLSNYKNEVSTCLYDKWNEDEKVQEVRDWLYQRQVPFGETVLLCYDNMVAKIDWKIFVTYWDSFAWSVGLAMYATTESKKWVCKVDHEDVITFYSN